MDFNHRWSLTTDTDITNKVRAQILNNEPNNDGSNLVVYQKSDDDTQIITVDQIGPYVEVDHSRYNPVTGDHIIGEKLGASGNLNIGFFSTIASLYLDALSRGHPIKISAIDVSMWKSYNKVIKYISQKFPGQYYVNRPTKIYDANLDISIYSRVIIPKSKSGLDYRNKIIEMLGRINKLEKVSCNEY